MINRTVDELKSGMILAKPVYNHQELMILDAGAKITDKHIRIFKSWGVAEVVVRGDTEEAHNGDVGSATETPAAIESELKQKFSEVLDDPVMLEILRAASRVLSKSLSEDNEDI